LAIGRRLVLYVLRRVTQPPPAPSASTSAYLVLVPAAVGQLVGGLESLWSVRQYRPDAILRGRSSLSAKSYLPKRLRRKLDTTAGAVVVHVLSVVGACLVLTGRSHRRQQIVGAAAMFAASKLFELRNPFGRDGSDQMAGVIAGYRLVTLAVPNQKDSDDLFLRAVNAQTCLSYLASGLAKLISNTWRSGEAMGQIVRTDIYGGTWFAALLQRRPILGCLVSWGTIFWEISFPLIYVTSPSAARLFLLTVKGFHFGVAMTMGLPRFFWGFSSAHAAVMYVIGTKNRRNEV